jgi:uncharacterized protein DUF4129
MEMSPTLLPMAHSEQASTRFWSILLTGIGFVLAAAGALSSPDGASAPGVVTRVWVPLPAWLGYGTAAAVSIASITFIGMALGSRRRRKNKDDDFEEAHEPEKVPILFKVLLILLALAPGLVMAGATYWVGQSSDLRIPVGSAGFDASGLMENGPSLPASPVTTGLIEALAWLIGLGSLAVMFWLCFGDRFKRKPTMLASGPSEELTAAVEESLDDLRAEPDARLAIMKIWRNFETALADAALPRRPSQTPLEFMRAVLGKMPGPRLAVHRLTDVFERARFSQHPIGAQERDTAWQSLIAIHTALREKDGRSDATAS